MTRCKARRAVVPVPALILLALLIGSAQPAAAQCVGIPGCVLVWSDEFDGTAVDLSKWSFQLGNGTSYGLPPGWGNNERQAYRAENATVSGGFLTITAKEEPFGALDYTSARMRSLGKGDWTFGRMEMRARMPIGKGLWPAFWMLPSDSTIYGTWAASGEIDIVEYIGSEPNRIFGTLHYGGPYPNNVYSSTSRYIVGSSYHDGFHDFAVEWEPGRIRWYMDGVLYASRSSWYSTGGPFPAPFDVDFHLLLNLAVGGNLPGDPDATTVFPQEFVIDYVRVYQEPNDPPAVAITSPTPEDVLTPGNDVTIAVTATDDGAVQLVQFLQDKAIIGEDRLPPFELGVPSVAAGCYSLTARARDDRGVLATSDAVEITVGDGCQQAPYRMTPTAVPGTIEMEEYDIGGQGVAYHDSDAGNNGGAYRPAESVDIESTTDAGYGFNVGWTSPGEWIEYTVDAIPGTYDVKARVASDSTGGTFHIEIDGADRTGPVAVNRTFGWQNWTTINVGAVTFEGGVQTLRFVFDAGSFNINKLFVLAPQPVEETNGCNTTADDPCERTGTCWIEGSSWYQVVTVDRAGTIDTSSWSQVCDLVHAALGAGDCGPHGARTEVTAYIDTTSFADIPAIEGPLACADAPPAPVGAVPNGADRPGVPLTVRAEGDGSIVLDWGASCLPTDGDYVVYEGPLGSFASHTQVTCSTGGATTWTLTPATESSYYLIAPTDGISEGSHGRNSSGAERPSGTTCFPLNVGECPGAE